MKYYGDYILGTEVQWQTFCQNFNMNWNEVKLNARIGTDLFLVELFDTNFRKLARAYELGMVCLKQYQASQLGKDLTEFESDDGKLASKYEIYSLLYAFGIIKEPVYKTDDFVILESDKTKLKLQLDKYKVK